MKMFDSCQGCNEKHMGCHSSCETYLIESVIRSVNKPKREEFRAIRSKSYYKHKSILTTHKR